MVAHDYETGETRSFETGSRAEARIKPEHIAHNTARWEGMGFAGCDVWSDATAVGRMGPGLEARLRGSVRRFVLQGGEWTGRPALERVLVWGPCAQAAAGS